MLSSPIVPSLRRGVLRTIGVCAILYSISACQPTPQERILSAKQYMESGEYQAAVIELKNALRVDPTDAEARALIASSSYQIADFPTAVDEYRRALELGDDSKSSWIGLGESLLRMGRAAEASEGVSPNLDESAVSDSELCLQGDIYAALGNYDDARRLFSAAIALHEKSERGLVGLAILAAGGGDTEEARRLLAKATQSSEATSRSWQILGNYRRVRGDFTGASSAFETAIDMETAQTNLADRFETRAALATTAIDMKNLPLARSAVAELARIFPRHPVLDFLSGRIAFADGDLNLASRKLQEYLSNSPKDLRAFAVMGAISFSQNYYSQAEMYLQQAVRGDVGGDGALRLLAETRLRLNRPQETLELLRGANPENTADASLLGLLGRAEFSSGNRSAGLEYFEKGVAAEPQEPAINLAYAMALISDGQNEKAIEILSRLPDHEDVRHRREILLIAALERNGQRERAVESAKEFLALNSKDAAAHALIGAFKRGINETAQAGAHFQDALKLDEKNDIALFGIASLAYDRGDFAASEYALGELLNTRPAYMPGLAMLARILLPRGRNEELAGRVDAAVSASPHLSGPRLLQARLALASGKSDLAFEYIGEMRELFADLPALRHLEGVALIRLGQTESALISLTRAAKAEPGNARYQFDLAVARLQSRDFHGANEAISAYREIRPADPVGLSIQVSALLGQRGFAEARQRIAEFAGTAADAATVSVLRGDIDLADGLASEAADHFEFAAESLWDRGIALRLSSAYLAAGSPKATQPLAKWLKEHPDDVAVRRSYGELLQSSGARSQAIAEYERVIATNENDAIALNNLAWEYSLQGNPEAVDMARRAYELQPGHASIVDTYGWILYLNDQPEEAASLLRKAAKMSPQNGNILYHLAKVLADTGRRDEASQIITGLIEADLSFSKRAEALELAKSL